MRLNVVAQDGQTAFELAKSDTMKMILAAKSAGQPQMTAEDTVCNTTASSPEVSESHNTDDRWDWFITHCQSDGGILAVDIFHEFEKRGLSVWLDVKMDERDEAAMKRGIEGSEKVLVIVTESYFTRPFCLKELRWARDAGRDLVVCMNVLDKERIGEFLGNAPEDLRCIGDINFIDMNRGDKDYFLLGIQKLINAAPKKLKGSVGV